MPKSIIRGYYEDLAAGRLVGKKCRACDTITFPPTALCEKCGKPDLEDVTLTGEGEVLFVSHSMAPPPMLAAVGLRDDAVVGREDVVALRNRVGLVDAVVGPEPHLLGRDAHALVRPDFFGWLSVDSSPTTSTFRYTPDAMPIAPSVTPMLVVEHAPSMWTPALNWAPTHFAIWL